MASILKNIGGTGISRRNFIAASAAALGTLGAAGLSGCAPASVEEEDLPSTGEPEIEQKGEWVSAICWNHCGGQCPLHVLKVDNTLLRIKGDDSHEDSMDWPQQRACLRGYTRIDDVLGANRLKYPMKRKSWQPGGETINGDLRGRDDWERISWDEALDIVASEITRIKNTYGNRAIFGSGSNTNVSTNDQESIQFSGHIMDLEWVNVLNAYGGQVRHMGTASTGSFKAASKYGYGNSTGNDLGNDRFDARDCDTFIFFGANIAYSAGGSYLYSALLPLKGTGKKIYVIDPFYNDTAATLEAEWVPIRPGTDIALMNAMAYVMLTEDDPDSNPLIDWDIIDRCTVGFDENSMPEGSPKEDNFKDFILGTYDALPKTPEWASEICGVSPEKIVEIARLIGKDNKVALTSAWALGRTNNSEPVPQMLMILGAMGGHFGKPGHHMGSTVRSRPLNNTKSIIKQPFKPFPYIPNDVDDVIPDPVQWKSILEKKYTWTGWEAQNFDPAEEREIDIKCIYNYSLNMTHRTEWQLGAIEAYRQMEFVVTHSFDFNVNAQYSDIVLPLITPWENYPQYKLLDITEFVSVGGGIIDPLYECKSAQWIGEELLKRWGIDPKTVYPKTAGQTRYELLASLEVLAEDGETYEKLIGFTPDEIAQFDAEGEPQEGRISYTDILNAGIYSVKRHPGDKYGAIGLKGFRENPDESPLKSASGKMEFYCSTMSAAADALGFAKVPALPEYIPPLNGYEATFEGSDPASGKKGPYPFQVFNPHYLRSAHAHFDNIASLREACTRPVYMNNLDAAEYGLKDGDTVRVYNEWGSIIRTLSVTKRMIRGVLGVTHGGWLEIDEDTGYDIGGSASTLCAPMMTGTRVSAYNTQIGAIELYSGAFSPDAERVPVAPECQA